MSIEKFLTNDLSNFIKTYTSRLYLFRVYSALEFGAVTKALPSFVKKNRAIKLILIDGLHYLEQRKARVEPLKKSEVESDASTFLLNNSSASFSRLNKKNRRKINKNTIFFTLAQFSIKII